MHAPLKYNRNKEYRRNSGPFHGWSHQSKSEFSCHCAIRTFISTHQRNIRSTPDRITNRPNAHNSPWPIVRARALMHSNVNHTVYSHKYTHYACASSFAYHKARAHSTTTSQFLSFTTHTHTRAQHLRPFFYSFIFAIVLPRLLSRRALSSLGDSCNFYAIKAIWHSVK